MILNFCKFYTKFPWNFPAIFRNFPQNLLKIFTTFRNSYEYHSQNFYILSKNFLNNYYIYINLSNNFDRPKLPEHRKIWLFDTDENYITFWYISRKWLAHSYRIPNSRLKVSHHWSLAGVAVAMPIITLKAPTHLRGLLCGHSLDPVFMWSVDCVRLRIIQIFIYVCGLSCDLWWQLAHNQEKIDGFYT